MKRCWGLSLRASQRSWRNRLYAYPIRRLYSTSDNTNQQPAAHNNESALKKQERDAHIERLAKYYPPALLQSILAAESAVTPEMWASRESGATEFAPPYGEDYSEIHPLYDFADGEWLDKTKPRQPIPQELPPDSIVEDIKSSSSPTAINLTRLEQLTGLRIEYLRSLMFKSLIRKRVVNMTRLGKKSSFYALSVVGDGNGRVGIGEGRGGDMVSSAVASANWQAAKNLTYIPRFKERTIYGNVELKQGAVHLQLRAARPGSGLRVHRIIYEICKVAGIKDLVGNVYGSRNPMNVAKAAVTALSSKQVLIDEIAANRGKRIVDVTSTYLNF